MIRLTRQQALWAGLAAVLLFYGINRLQAVLRNDRVDGTVQMVQVTNDTEKTSGGVLLFVNFIFDYRPYSFSDEASPNYEIGDKVGVIFPKGEPDKAELYDKTEFWLNGLLLSAVIFLIWLAFVLSFITKNERATIRLWSRKKKDPTDEHDHLLE